MAASVSSPSPLDIELINEYVNERRIHNEPSPTGPRRRQRPPGVRRLDDRSPNGRHRGCARERYAMNGTSSCSGRSASVLVLLALIGVASVAPVFAQITTGTVSGTVTDSQGGVLPGATLVLESETQGTRTTPVVSGANGDFVVPNVRPDNYTLVIEMPSFKTVRRSGVAVSPGGRISLGAIALEVGGTTEIVNVEANTTLIQASSGERSFTVATESVENLPIANRSFTALVALTPGVSGTNRIGGGGSSNVMMDGMTTIDQGSNAVLLQMSVESIAEVKVLTSNYQAEYGRSSGLQISAVTKSGTNQFRGSVYNVERNSDWNANSRTNVLNGDPKETLRERDWGYSIGGPIGRPGGENKLFFFYSHEFSPRTAGNNVVRFRLPTALERQGDFSQTLDNLGNPYPYVRDPRLAGTCSPTNQEACFADGGVVGRIPADQLYATGLNILNMWPLPNVSGAGVGYNYEIVRPTESALAWQPAVKIDLHASPALRVSAKYSGKHQRNQVFNGTLPGFNDTRMARPVVYTMATTVNYTLGPTTFLESTYGRSYNELAGCSLSGTGPVFCLSGFAMNTQASLSGAGLDGLPELFPEARRIDSNYYAHQALASVAPPYWQNGNVMKPPTFTWGNRIANAPPSIGYPGFANTLTMQDFSISLTKVRGSHTYKTGFYVNHGFKAQQSTTSNAAFGAISFQHDTPGTNPFDTSFGFANAAIGTFSSYNQSSKYVEGQYLYRNIEGYVQDNWRVSNRLTFDYGVRFVHQQPQYDELEQAANFLPDEWTASSAPALYVPGCVGTSPCSGRNRQAMNPVTGELLGENSALAIGALIPQTGDPMNGLLMPGADVPKTAYLYPSIGVAPRFGMAYDLKGDQRLVLRGGGGLFFDRPQNHSVTSNPPSSSNVTVRYGQLQDLNSAGLSTQSPPALRAVEYNMPLHKSVQWNAGLQAALPWQISADLAYVGQHAWDQIDSPNINAIDFGVGFQPGAQDPTLPANVVPGAVSYAASAPDLARPMRGYGAIAYFSSRGWNTYHSMQVSLQRRFAQGLSFGFTDTITLSDRGSTAARLQHALDGSFSYRDDQAEADRLLRAEPARHTMKANVVWALPRISTQNGALRPLALLANDWQVSGVWTGTSATPYTVGFAYQSGGSSVNLTGSPDYGARIRIVGEPGAGCSDDRYRQFNAAAFAGPLPGSVGLESGANYLKGCFVQALDLSLARNIPLGGTRNIQLRIDMFNAFNQAIATGRNATVNLSSPDDPTTARNLPFDANGNLIESRSTPRNAGFGGVTAYQAPRSVQAQIRFSF